MNPKYSHSTAGRQYLKGHECGKWSSLTKQKGRYKTKHDTSKHKRTKQNNKHKDINKQTKQNDQKQNNEQNKTTKLQANKEKQMPNRSNKQKIPEHLFNCLYTQINNKIIHK